MYHKCAADTIDQFCDGYNGTIFCYGQSGSGKTFSMLGPDEVVDVIKQGVDNVPIEMQMKYGIIPLSVIQIFTRINGILDSDKTASFEMKCQYIEIYNEKVNDLLS